MYYSNHCISWTPTTTVDGQRPMVILKGVHVKNVKIIKYITINITCGNESFYCTLFVNKLLLLLLLLCALGSINSLIVMVCLQLGLLGRFQLFVLKKKNIYTMCFVPMFVMLVRLLFTPQKWPQVFMCSQSQ